MIHCAERAEQLEQLQRGLHVHFRVGIPIDLGVKCEFFFFERLGLHVCFEKTSPKQYFDAFICKKLVLTSKIKKKKKNSENVLSLRFAGSTA